jgi:hypothetical protein
MCAVVIGSGVGLSQLSTAISNCIQMPCVPLAPLDPQTENPVFPHGSTQTPPVDHTSQTLCANSTVQQYAHSTASKGAVICCSGESHPHDTAH